MSSNNSEPFCKEVKKDKSFIHENLIKFFCFLYSNIDFESTIETVYKKTWKERIWTFTPPTWVSRKIVNDITYDIEILKWLKKEKCLLREKTIFEYLKMYKDNRSLDDWEHAFMFDDNDTWENHPGWDKWYLMKKASAENSTLFIVCSHLTYKYWKAFFWIWYKELYDSLHKHISIDYDNSINTSIKLLEIWFYDHYELEEDVNIISEKENKENMNLPINSRIGALKNESKTKSLLIPKIICHKLYITGKLANYILYSSNITSNTPRIIFRSEKHCKMSKSLAKKTVKSNLKWEYNNTVLVDYQSLSKDYVDVRISPLKDKKSFREIIDRLKENRDFDRLMNAAWEQIYWRIERKEWIDIWDYKDSVLDSAKIYLNLMKPKEIIKLIKNDQQEMYNTSWYQDERFQFYHKVWWCPYIISKMYSPSSDRDFLYYIKRLSPVILKIVFWLDFEKIQQKKTAIARLK